MGKLIFFIKSQKTMIIKKQYWIAIISLFGIDSIKNMHRAVRENIAFCRGFSDKTIVRRNGYIS